MESKLGHGVYSFSEAAQLTELRIARVREWFRGHKRGDARKGVVFCGDYTPVGGDFAISFFDLVDVFVAGQLREHGVSMQTVRKVFARLGADLGTKHPFCRQELESDGREVFLRGIDDCGKDELVEVLTRQRVFPEIILPFLKKIDYDRVRLLALRWRIADQIVIDPSICFGKPVVIGTRIPTGVLAAAFNANHRDFDLVADWYGITPEQVRSAVQFENKLAA